MNGAILAQLMSELGRNSLQAAVLVVAVLIAQRLCGKHLAPRWRCALWLLVVVRLLVPVSIGSTTSIFNVWVPLMQWTSEQIAPVPAHAEADQLKPKPIVAASFVVKEPKALPLGQPQSVKPLIDPAISPKLSQTSMPVLPQVIPTSVQPAIKSLPVVPASRVNLAIVPGGLASQVVSQHPIAVQDQPEAPAHAELIQHGRIEVLSWPICLFWIWLGGAAVLLGHIVILSLRLAHRCARLKPLTDQKTLAILDECRERMKMTSRLYLAVSETIEVSTPALHGIVHPRLLLPKGFTSKFSSEELRFVFLHELAHLKRRDLWMNWIMALLQAVHWFNPLVWLGFARWRDDRELACDAMVLEATGAERNQEYGATILNLLENFTPPLRTPGLVGILEDKRQLHQRITMIASYIPAPRWSLLALLLIAVLSVVGLTDARSDAANSTTNNAAALQDQVVTAQINLELKDGSQVIGKSLDDPLKFHSASLGDFKLPVSGIRSIEFKDGGGSAKLTATNGDIIDAQFVAPSIHVETGFGKSELQVKLIRKINITTAGQVSQQIPGLVALWSGNGNGNDSTGTNNAIVPAGVTYAPAKVGDGFQFSGNVSGVSVPASPELNVGTGPGFTLACWINPSSIYSQQPLMEWRVGTHFWISVRGTGNLFANIADVSGVFHQISSANSIIQSGIFQHVAVTYDKSSGMGNLYYNGKLIASQNLGVFTPKTDSSLLFGERIDGEEIHYQGILNELSIYNRALSSDEIQSIYEEQSTGGDIATKPNTRELPPATSTNPIISQLTIELKDGSRVIGKSLDDPLKFHSAALGDFKLPVLDIRSITFTGDGNSAKLTATNGDIIDVQFVAPSLHVLTGFGKSELHTKLIRKISNSTLGKEGHVLDDFSTSSSTDYNTIPAFATPSSFRIAEGAFAPMEPPGAFGTTYFLRNSGECLSAAGGQSVSIEILATGIQAIAGNYVNGAGLGFSTSMTSDQNGNEILLSKDSPSSCHLGNLGIIIGETATGFCLDNGPAKLTVTRNAANPTQFDYVLTGGGLTQPAAQGVISYPASAGLPVYFGMAATYNGRIDSADSIREKNLTFSIPSSDLRTTHAESSAASKPANNSTNQSPLQLTLELKDGSRVIGKYLDDPLKFHSAAFGDFKLPITGIRSITFAGDGDAAKLTATNGDVLDVQLTAPTLHIQTGFGKSELAIKLIRQLKCSFSNFPDQQIPGLVALWSGNGNGDDSVETNNGVVSPGTTYAPAKAGDGFQFDGNNSGVAIPPSPALNVGAGPGLTLACWISPASVLNPEPLIEWRGDPTSMNWAQHFGTHFWICVLQGGIQCPGNLYANFLDSTGNVHIISTPPGLIQPGVMQYVAATYDKATGIGNIYYNGSLVVSQNLGTFTPKTDTPLLLGERIDGLSQDHSLYHYPGLMNEVAIYNRALSTEEIKAIYAATPPESPVIESTPIISATSIAPSSEGSTNAAASQLSVELMDGSRMIGKCLDDPLKFHSPALGDFKFPMAGIRSLDFAADGASAKLTATNGDVLDVGFASPVLHVETSLGKSELPVKNIRRLKVLPPGQVSEVSTGLINVDFGGGDALALSPKTGFAAIGQTTNDFWNFDAEINDLHSGMHSASPSMNFKLANGQPSSVNMTVWGAFAAWSSDSSDPMYKTYEYASDGGDKLISFSNLPPGVYQVLVYAPDGSFDLNVGGTVTPQPLASISSISSAPPPPDAILSVTKGIAESVDSFVNDAISATKSTLKSVTTNGPNADRRALIPNAVTRPPSPIFTVTGGTDFGAKSTHDPSTVGAPVWKEGVQYVRWENVTVKEGESLILTVKKRESGPSLLSGIQLTSPALLNSASTTGTTSPVASQFR